MLVANPSLIDLKSIKFGKVYEFSYIIENKDINPAVVTEIVEGCKSCTKAYLSSKTINPGEVAILHVSYTPGSTGRQLKFITLIYNDGENLKVEFKGTSHE